jgi:hypothetical protein
LVIATSPEVTLDLQTFYTLQKCNQTNLTDRTLIDACVSPSFRTHQIITDYNLASIGTNFWPTFVHICQMERLNDGHTQCARAPAMTHTQFT